jgi:hypothetical protein
MSVVMMAGCELELERAKRCESCFCGLRTADCGLRTGHRLLVQKYTGAGVRERQLLEYRRGRAVGAGIMQSDVVNDSLLILFLPGSSGSSGSPRSGVLLLQHGTTAPGRDMDR